MTYTRNSMMEYLEIDEETLVVYDPESGDSHYFNDSGKSILDCLAEPMSAEALIAALCEQYGASPDELREDVREFLAELTEKRVVTVQ